MFLEFPPDEAESIHSRFTSAMLHWFRKTPICIRQILCDCTSDYNLPSNYPKSETLREVIADTTRYPWSPNYKPFDTSLIDKLWKMEDNAGLPRTSLYKLYKESCSVLQHYDSHSQDKKSEEGGGTTPNVTLGENVEGGGVKDAKQEISEELGLIG